MLDFTPVWRREITIDQLTAKLTRADLRNLTNEMIDTMLGSIAECVDADMTFVPGDADANGAAQEGWTLAHVIAHTTASSEESAVLAAELARGVEYHGRSRSEVPWERLTTVAQCRARLEESRRMRLASLELWPDTPDLELRHEPWPGAPVVNAVGRFVVGLAHDDSHLAQIEEIVVQARAARG